jgi:hypothetical protein
MEEPLYVADPEEEKEEDYELPEWDKDDLDEG